MTESDRSILKDKLISKLSKLEVDIAAYRELTKPISPENAIGRISRMDAINNKSVNEAALRNTLQKKHQLEQTLSKIETESFGLCRQCGNAIEIAKLMAFPESIRCVICVKSER